MYKDIFEFQDKNKTTDAKLKAFSQMSESEAKKLIATCGTPQGKVAYTKLYKQSQK